jgi:hypothetical protein
MLFYSLPLVPGQLCNASANHSILSLFSLPSIWRFSHYLFKVDHWNTRLSTEDGKNRMLGVFQVGLKAEIVKVLPAYLHFAVVVKLTLLRFKRLHYTECSVTMECVPCCPALPVSSGWFFFMLNGRILSCILGTFISKFYGRSTPFSAELVALRRII